MSDSLLETVEVGPADASASVIWLHGLGADGHDFEPIVPELQLPAGAAVRFVFPHAPVRPVTLNGGMAMRAWYDIIGLDRQARQDEAGLAEAAGHARALIAREGERGVPAERVVLAGFSQGGAVALHTGLRHPERLAGIMGLSTYLPLPARLADEASDANRRTPVFLAHGEYDPVLAFELGTSTRNTLEDAGYDVEWHQYPMQHQVCLEEIQALGQWLRRALALQPGD
ncbi:alpha/beta hydrolase [Spiribacter halobius]|uniref:Carboxylesterase n=1 Tax=Sediminicurvatus halobius TaxID=2182432 RepID=A0A2U2N2V4_9GAMM|nr:alpha/beta hydrolase-fold protein [Spiribacter halobius]PWG63412.1 carboxylesterase [Spiribacter halobius]UEX78082.1 dienelactone hydrolase family protein [Spiribacter halobius]